MRGKQTQQSSTGQPKRLWRSKALRSIGVLVLVAAVFAGGVNVGNGTISWSHSTGRNGSLPETLNYSAVNDVYKSLIENYDGKLTESQLINGLKHGLAEATKDPYTSYFTPTEAQSFNDSLQGQFSGIGAELGKNEQGNIQVIAPIAGTPAEKAGIKPRDVIATVNGKTTVGMSVDDAVKAIRGTSGSKVKLQLVRGGTEALVLEITRETIHIPSVTTKTLDGNVGYLQVSTFGADTAGLVHQAAAKFKQDGVKGMVLDLRNNPGGQVDTAVSIASEWLPENQLIMQEKRGNTVIQTYQSTGSAQLASMPTVVLINDGSASASEIVAAALHDNKHAYIIGEKSYGKGVVQRIINFGDDSQLKVTVASWFRPNGKNINHQGITPDQKVALSDADAKATNDTQLKAAQAYLAK
ncbi:MAG: Peptidase [Candidatus Saccharibacteria bacterium]|nr:Peptidase [Candidatus Saccharibacteria bacterium]